MSSTINGLFPLSRARQAVSRIPSLRAGRPMDCRACAWTAMISSPSTRAPMAKMNMIQALNSAMDIAMGRAPAVVVLGQDVGFFGGVFRCTDGLQRKYGEHRVLDTPIAEGGIIAAAIGMGVNGLRPVAEVQFADYVYPGYDQIVSELARLRYRSAGEFFAPVTVRMPCGRGLDTRPMPSHRPEVLFAHVCGLKV